MSLRMRFLLLSAIIGTTLCALAVDNSVSSACVAGNQQWTAFPLGVSQTGTFTFSFDATPNANSLDTSVGLSQNLPADYNDLAVIIRFNLDGNIDVRNGNGYSALYQQTYTANSSYRFVVAVNLATRTYSVLVTPPGGSQRALATNYAFRTQQSRATSLNYWTNHQDRSSSAAIQVCNFTLGSETSSAPVTSDPVNPTPSACRVGSTTWTATLLGVSQSGTFSVSFDATAQANGIDAVVGLSQNLPADYNGLAALVRFNPKGNIDVRNGNAYAALYRQPYTAKSTYRFVVAVNVSTRTYSVLVTPPGGSQKALATNYAFRTQQSQATSLNYWTTYQDRFSSAPLEVCNFTLAPTTDASGLVASTPVAVAVNPSSTSLNAGATQQFAASVTGSTNTGVTWSATGGNISAAGLYTAPTTAGTYTVLAKSIADPTKSASATVSVTVPPPPVSVAINPSSTTLNAGATQQFAASVTGSTNTGVTWSATGGTISAAGLYTAPTTAGTYTVRAVSTADSSKSASATVTVSPSTSPCLVGSTQWTATLLGTSQTGTFTFGFDATPQGNGIDATVGLSQNLPTQYNDLALIVRFNPAGNIDVRNGADYAALYPQPYTANTIYRFVVAVNVSAHTYSVYVTPPGGTQQMLASNYAFRDEQANSTSLSYWTTYQDPFSAAPLQVCDFSLPATGAITVSAPVTVTVTPASASLNAGAKQQFTASVSGSTNTAVTWSATAGTISSTGLYTAPLNGGTYTVKATSVADPAKSASVNVSVTPVAVSLTPNNTTVNPSGTVQFSATVTGSANTAVTWAVATGGGTISSNGLYTAAATAGSATVVATSTADPRVSALAQVTIQAPATLFLSVSPTSVSFGSVMVGSSVTKPISLSNTGNTAVTISSASISGTGFGVSGISFPVSLAPGATRSANVTFTPSSSGTVTGSVSFVSDATNSPATATLSGSATQPLPRSVTLSWQASTSGSSYNVYRSQTSGGAYTPLSSTPVLTNSFVDSDVSSGQTYFYVVTTVDSSGGESGYSGEATAVIPTL